MKKIVISTLIAALLLTNTAFAASPIDVVVGGEKIESDVAAIIIDGRTMLPLRAVFEAIGAEVEWIAEERKVIASKKGRVVEFVVDSNIMKVNGEEKEIDVPAMIINSRTLVPVRACAEAFDLKVEWNQDTKTVKVRKKVSLKTNVNGKIKWEYDSNGNLTYYEEDYGGISWEKYSYDKNDNVVYKEWGSGEDSYWEQYEYDAKGNEVYRINSVGDWTKSSYDENENLIRTENITGFSTYTYDENGNLLTRKSGERILDKYTYDSNNKLATHEDYILNIKNTYNQNGDIIQTEGINNKVLFSSSYYEYDENGNIIYKKILTDTGLNQVIMLTEI